MLKELPTMMTKMEVAVDSYVKGKTSLERSSEVAGVSLWTFLDELRNRNVALKYSLTDAESEIQKILEKSGTRKFIICNCQLNG